MGDGKGGGVGLVLFFCFSGEGEGEGKSGGGREGSAVPLEMASSSCDWKPSRPTCSGTCGHEILFKAVCAWVDISSGVFPHIRFNMLGGHFFYQIVKRLVETRTQFFGVSVFGCASEGTAVDTGDAPSTAATDILGMFARDARTDLATPGAMRKQFLKNLFLKEVAAVKYVSLRLSKHSSNMMQL